MEIVSSAQLTTEAYENGCTELERWWLEFLKNDHAIKTKFRASISSDDAKIRLDWFDRMERYNSECFMPAFASYANATLQLETKVKGKFEEIHY